MAKMLINKEKKEFVKDLNREITVIKQKAYYVKDIEQDFHTDYGFVSKKDLKKTGVVKTSSQKEFSLFDASFIDDYRRISRLAQIIPLKDIGSIIAYSGLTKKSIVLDAGTGSGALSIFLANIVKEVVSYDISDEHLKIAKENVKRLGIKNLKIKKKDIYTGFDEKDADLITLDLPSPWNAIGVAHNALKLGGFLVSYSPSLTQAVDFVNQISNNHDFIHLNTIEIIERSWDIDKRIVRPDSRIIVSGFLSFCRKIR